MATNRQRMTDIELHPPANKYLPPDIHGCLFGCHFDENVVLELAAGATAEPGRMMNYTPRADSRFLSESSPHDPEFPGAKTIRHYIKASDGITHSQSHSPAQRVPTTINWWARRRANLGTDKTSRSAARNTDDGTHVCPYRNFM